MKLLYATDFKDSSRKAADVIKKLLKKNDHAQLVSMHIVTSFWKDWLSSGMYEKEAETRLNEWHKDIVGKEEPEQVMIAKGSPAAAILDAIVDTKPDLLVVGGGDPGAKREWITGTTAEAIVREAECSAMLIKKPDLKRLLVAVDLDERCLVALKGAVELAEKMGSEVIILHAIPAPDENTLGMPDHKIKEHEEVYRKEHIQKIDEFIAQIDTSKVKTKRENHWGVAHDVILDYAADHDIDMIVIGDSRKSRVRQALMGSTSSRILRYAPASLYVVRH